ncbi:glycosyltransferase family 2 protein [Streptococcus iniae]|uniref:glycosyltransferase family 2 protein n=1 Tax=Streptococcus iniae TaxID=1346 RepID=UPI0008DA612B|nr:glycosyltransferase family 2 protein [Streptococcus iniae]OHX28077.1 alpha-L-Rha alpha-1,3-L-rhamnosyltransferase [Streptococcus iniae]RLV27707.1 glycosyltransferase family 2 protein [Streptococcus iniae]
MKINILMSTYNGEKFLAQQIESIQKQTVKDWDLLIRDDGSTDRTPQIIQEFAKTDSRIRFINPNNRQNFGVVKNFHTLVKFEVADFYFFSDQDDVWLEDKLALTLAESNCYELKKPLLVYTDLKIVNQKLEVTNVSMIKTQSHHANTSLVEELTENTVTGGTMMINHALAKEWTVTENLLMHDWYLALLASGLGNLVYLDHPTELYRQHDSNVLGARTWSKRMKNWIRPHQLIDKYWWLITSSQKQAKLLLDHDLSTKDYDMVQDYVTLLDKNLKQRIITLKKYGFKKNRAFHTLVFSSLIITKFGYRRQ